MHKILLVTFAILFCGGHSAFGQGNTGEKQSVYVWDFATRDLKRDALTEKFTHDFEAALIQSNQAQFRVIERRNLDQLISQIKNEQTAQDILQISESAIKSLKSQQADLVIFGEVFDDVDSGDIHVTVTFQAFDGTKTLIKRTLIKRGIVNDATSRMEAMAALVSELSARTARVQRVQENEFIFELKECSVSERKVHCQVLITNNGDDRDLRLCDKEVMNAHGCDLQSSRIFDESSTESKASTIRFAGKETSWGTVDAFLVASRPANATLVFEGVSSKIASLSRFDLACQVVESETNFMVTFRNIPLKR